MDITPYLKLMVERNASDMYLSTGAPPNVKIEGVTAPVGKTAAAPGVVKKIAASLVTEDQMKAFEESLELDTAISIPDVGRFRVNLFVQRGEVSMVVRYVKWDVPSLEQLRLPPALADLIMEPRGLIIVAGSTGAGKSTTLASMIDHRNRNKSGHILTIEDPIEFIHKHNRSIVNQREVGLDTASYAEALRRAVREAPDVIMIGEIRDHDVMKQALSYADTGHLCLATLHATNADQAMDRIINFLPDVPREQLLMDLSLNLRAVISQRLLRSTDGKRVAATEIIQNTPYVKALLRDGDIHKIKSAMEEAPENVMHTFDQDIMRLYQAKKVALEEAMEHADDSEHMRLKLRLGGHDLTGEADDIYG
ncbi:MAG: PilT/PilU family type 4a pilus ATPase [Pseudomonadota bacterium]|nr:MAG: PilT/PilU family type 4a pilus ATPase [Pseudomonadota bacterium]